MPTIYTGVQYANDGSVGLRTVQTSAQLLNPLGLLEGRQRQKFPSRLFRATKLRQGVEQSRLRSELLARGVHEHNASFGESDGCFRNPDVGGGRSSAKPCKVLLIRGPEPDFPPSPRTGRGTLILVVSPE